jgi:enamine deaminase RidA (YjgF/YER057c/UK114 family)
MVVPEIQHYLDPDNHGENYSSAVRYDGLIFVSGQLGAVPGGPWLSFDDQLRTALGRMIRAVEQLGGERDTLLKVNGYIAKVEYFPRYHHIYRDLLPAPEKPARTTVQVGGFLEPILVEIDAIAGVRRTPTT